LRNPEFDALMQRLCVGLGWCGGIVDGRKCSVMDFIPSEGPVSADQFVDWVIRGDGGDPATTPKSWKTHIRAAFVLHMGGEVVDASRLRWE
jgi:hypothetical protein